MDNKDYEKEPTEKSFTVHDLPSSERPRERLKKSGPAALSSMELLALILGKGVKGESVLVTAQKLLSKFGSLRGILEASMEDLLKIKGLGPAKASQLLACFEISKRVVDSGIKEEKNKLDTGSVNDAAEAAELVRSYISNHSREHFYVLAFDVRNRLIDIEQVSQGSLNASVVHPRETFEAAIRKHAANIMIAHNHPSGDLEPSDDDIRITKRLSEAGKVLGIELLDHIIVSRSDYFSFKDGGLI